MNTYQIDYLKNKAESVKKLATDIIDVVNAHADAAARNQISVEKTYDIAALEYFHDKLLLTADHANEVLSMVDSLRKFEFDRTRSGEYTD